MKNYEQGSEQPLDSSEFADSLALKEIFQVLGELKADEQTVLGIIENALLEPIPKTDDSAEIAEFNHRMANLKEIAQAYLARADLLKSVEDKIQAKVEGVTPASG